jgi:predicted TIM-barrel fold metal-dependent hydrolase
MILDYHTGQHGTRLSLAKPEKFDDVAFDYPELRMVFEHMGGRPYYEEFAAVLAGHRGHCFGGLTSIFNPEHYLWYIAPFIEEIIHSLGAQHFIFGLDFPWNSIEANQRDLAFIRSLDLSAEDRAMILGGNLAGLLGIHLD